MLTSRHLSECGYDDLGAAQQGAHTNVSMDQNEMVLPVMGEEDSPIATEWRPVLRDVVRALVRGDYALVSCGPHVRLRTRDTAEHIQTYIASYGATLVELPEATWTTSIAQWNGSGWNVFVDLWTAEEGRSDMILDVRVEGESDWHFEVHLVYVP